MDYNFNEIGVEVNILKEQNENDLDLDLLQMKIFIIMENYQIKKNTFSYF